MDWLSSHSARVDYRKKIVECFDDLGREVEIVGVKRPISLRMISSMQLKRCMRRGCQLFAVTLEDVDDMPPKRDIDFRIDLVPGAEPISRAPYRMTT
ncbi:hypothetical protein SUGI_0291790 [Cryptomeria japonica]|nr:hypothetical protein SUGI_0291790 [Cryptomeria japonica]